MLNLLVLCLVAAAGSLPAENGENVWETTRLHPDDYTALHRLHRRSVTTYPAGFKSIFLDAHGITSNTRGQIGTQIELVRSPQTPAKGLIVAAEVVSRITKFMPSILFKQLATSASVGVFTAAEKLTIFPEYKYLANGKCGKSCVGSCSQSCVKDGRKWDDIAGIGGRMAGILYDNLLCTDKDPYYKKQNILAHEFAHTIYFYALSVNTKTQVTTAYKNAKAKGTWKLSSYAMSNDFEYFAEGSAAFHYVYRNNDVAGSMFFCGNKLCPSLQATREQLRQKDPAFYSVLSYVYTDNRPQLSSGLSVCPPVSLTG